jgi:predicted ATP-grasp superfamily ATP-dependent carboligase
MTREQELDFLKEQAKAVREQLEDIEARMREPEATGA